MSERHFAFISPPAKPTYDDFLRVMHVLCLSVENGNPTADQVFGFVAQAGSILRGTSSQREEWRRRFMDRIDEAYTEAMLTINPPEPWLP